MDGFNLLQEFVLPALELDALDVVEGLIDVTHALVMLYSFLLVKRALHVASDVANGE